MDGKGKAIDNIFVEQLWRSVKYEYLYLQRPESGQELYQGLLDNRQVANRFRLLLSNYRFVASILLLVALAASIQSQLQGTKTFVEGGKIYTNYNNYTIFERSFHHLKEDQNLYLLYPEEHWDLYRYSPSFAAFFSIFAIFPDWLGLSLWNIVNALMLLVGVYYLPKLSSYQKGAVLMLCLIELLGSIQNEQSNGLIAGLLILAFGLLEKEKYLCAALCLITTVYIKLFGIVGFALFLFYPQKGKLILYSLMWAVVLFTAPLLFTSIKHYASQLSAWRDLLRSDHSIAYGYSVMGWLQAWFRIEVNKSMTVLIGVVVFLLPLIRINQHTNYTFRFLTLTSILLWVVIFNHKAESPTFIIAMAGVALWFTISEKSTANILLFVSAFVFTSLSPTDLFPRFLRKEFVDPYMLKVFPCILVWVKIIYDMIKLDSDWIGKKSAHIANLCYPRTDEKR